MIRHHLGGKYQYLRKLVDSNDNLETKFARILDVLGEVLATFLQCYKILFCISFMQRFSWNHIWSPAVHFQGPCGGNNDRCIWLEAAGTAFNVAKLFQTHVSTESSLGENVTSSIFRIPFLRTGQFQSHEISKDRRVSMSNIGKGASVYEDGSTLQEARVVRRNLKRQRRYLPQGSASG